MPSNMPIHLTRSLNSSSLTALRNEVRLSRRHHITPCPYAGSVATTSCATLVDDKCSAHDQPLARSRSTTSSAICFDEIYLSREQSKSPYIHQSPLGRAACALHSFQYSLRLSKSPATSLTPLEECAAACYIALQEHGITKTSNSIGNRYPYVMPLQHFIHHVFSATSAPMKVIIHTIVLIMRRLRNVPEPKSDMVAYALFTRAFLLATSLALPAGIHHTSTEYWSRLTGYSESMIASFKNSEELFKFFQFKTYPPSTSEKQRLRRKTRLSVTTMLHPAQPLWPQPPPVCKPLNKPYDFVKDKYGCNILKKVERWLPAWQMGSLEFDYYLERRVDSRSIKYSNYSIFSSSHSIISSSRSIPSSSSSYS
jgi:hypothetical protein